MDTPADRIRRFSVITEEDVAGIMPSSISRARRFIGLTQEQLARAAGVSALTVTKAENARLGYPGMRTKTIAAICNALVERGAPLDTDGKLSTAAQPLLPTRINGPLLNARRVALRVNASQVGARAGLSDNQVLRVEKLQRIRGADREAGGRIWQALSDIQDERTRNKALIADKA